MNATRSQIDEGLFRHSVLGPVLTMRLRRGELKRRLQELAGRDLEDFEGNIRRVSWRTLEEWYYLHKQGGFDALVPRPRSDQGLCRILDPAIVELVVDLKKEDPGQSASQIRDTLITAGRIRDDQASSSTIRRILKRSGLSGPRIEVVRKDRFRFQAERCGDLSQSDCLHGPKLFNPRTKREETTKIFAILDDRSRYCLNIQAGFRETEAAFLGVLHGAFARRGICRSLYVDRGSSFIGRDLRLACARLNVRLRHAPVRDGASKGKIERMFRTLRRRLLDRLGSDSVKTLGDLNVRLMAWAEGDYNVRPHAALDGRTPREVWESGLEGIRWADSPSALDESFTGETPRKAKKDATVSFDGTVYEVPGHLRGQPVTLHYSFLDPSRVWVVDGTTEVPLKPLDAQLNLTRRRRHRTHTDGLKPRTCRTGLNPVEVLLDRVTGRLAARKGGESR